MTRGVPCAPGEEQQTTKTRNITAQGEDKHVPTFPEKPAQFTSQTTMQIYINMVVRQTRELVWIQVQISTNAA